MKGSRFTQEQIVGILREQEAGSKTADVCRKHGISDATFYKWKAKFGGLEVSEAKRLKALECQTAGVPVAVEQTIGREHVNLQAAIDLETGQTEILPVERVDADSTIALLSAIEARYPKRRKIYVYVDNARCHRAKIVCEWLAQPGRRIRLRFVPAYCPHLNPIDRLWGLMHKNLTHNRCCDSLRQFQSQLLIFLRRTVPENWETFCDQVSDNFRVRDPAKYRILR